MEDISPYCKTPEQRRKYYADKIVFKTPERRQGGQHVGLADPTIICESKDLNVSIKVGCCRSQMANRQLATTLMQLLIDDQIK